LRAAAGNTCRLLWGASAWIVVCYNAAAAAAVAAAAATALLLVCVGLHVHSCSAAHRCSLKLLGPYLCVVWPSRFLGKLMIMMASKGHFCSITGDQTQQGMPRHHNYWGDHQTYIKCPEDQ
jgi:hypothetical protein